MSRLIYSFGKVYKMNGPLKNISSKMHHRVPVKCSYIYLKTTTTMSHPYVLRGCLQNILLTVFLVLKYRCCVIFVKLEVYNFFPNIKPHRWRWLLEIHPGSVAMFWHFGGNRSMYKIQVSKHKLEFILFWFFFSISLSIRCKSM